MNFSGSSFKLNDLKDALMSRNTQIQIEAANSIVNLLLLGQRHDRAYCAKVLISFDIIEVICEAMSTMNEGLIQTCYKCCELLMICPEFSNRRHLDHLISSIINSINVFTSTDKHAIIAAGLTLLSNIIKRASKSEIYSTFRLDAAYQLLIEISEKGFDIPLLTPAINLFSCLVLDVKSVRQVESIGKVLPMFVQEISKNRDLRLVRTLANTIIRIQGIVQLDADNEFVEMLYSNFYTVCVEIMLPYLMVIDADLQSRSFITIIDSAISLLADSTHRLGNRISLHLITSGFLSALIKLQDRTMNVSLRKKYEKVMEHALVEGSRVELGEQYAWQDLLSIGMKSLQEPLWTFGYHQSLEANLTVLVYYYFYFTVKTDLPARNGLFRDLCKFITTLERNNSEMAPVIKPLWFVYSVCI